MFFEFFANIFFPRKCLACRERLSEGVICPACFNTIEIRGELVTENAANDDVPYILGAAGNYSDETLQTLIHGLKFSYIKDAAEPLGTLLITYVSKIGLDVAGFVILPIPLSRRRLRLRGFNQSELIAGYLAAAFILPLETHALARVKHAKPQSETKSAAERKENVRGGFGVIRPELVHGKNILLVDDVSTSGATFREASLALKAAGAEKILALAVAKT